MSEQLETIKALAEKLQAVADPARGSTPGEVEAAKLKLERLLTRHGLTLADVTSETRALHLFSVKSEQEIDLLFGIAHWLLESKVIRATKPRPNGLRRHNRRLTVQIEMTAAQAADMGACFTYYARELNRRKTEIERRAQDLILEEKHLVSAIAHKYKLFAPDDGEERDERPVDPKKLAAILAGMQGLRAGRWEKPAGNLATGALLLTGGAGS